MITPKGAFGSLREGGYEPGDHTILNYIIPQYMILLGLSYTLLLALRPPRASTLDSRFAILRGSGIILV